MFVIKKHAMAEMDGFARKCAFPGLNLPVKEQIPEQAVRSYNSMSDSFPVVLS